MTVVSLCVTRYRVFTGYQVYGMGVRCHCGNGLERWWGIEKKNASPRHVVEYFEC